MELTTQGTANDRFKRGFSDWFWYSIAVAAVVHLVMFAFWPEMTSADVGVRSDELTAIELPPEIEIPPPPEQIARPATPVVSSAQIDDDITIAPTTFDANPIENLPPPPTASAGADDISRAPTFTPMTVRPELQNTREIQRLLERNYPPLLRDAGIGGTPVVWFFIDENGRVLRTQLSKSSGYDALDAAAIQVANQMQFSPALNRDKRVQVWVEIPVVFTAR
ncbi:MAG TPA: energy transducer TonB [Longimicrobiales bacterium]|nr:energy transducer TonB [Longimicrobiales bacterium]